MIYQSLTQIVKLFQTSAQFQGVKSWKSATGAWVLRLEFYPGPQNLYIFAEAGQVRIAEKERKFSAELEPNSCPMALYLKAHFLNQRLRGMALEESALRLEFHPSGASFSLGLSEGDQLEFQAQVPERKDYRSVLKIAEVTESSDEAPTEEAPAGAGKQERLLGNIRKDLAEAQAWLEKYGPYVQALERDPSLWAQIPEDFAEPALLLRQELGLHGALPTGTARKASLDRVFQLRKRALRRVAGARTRLNQMEKRGPQTPRPQQSPATNRARDREENIGGRVEVADATGQMLVALYGRSAQENGDLFRQAASRDLWFHVRGFPGGHVWIPRGQPALGAKAEASEALIQAGCQLALFNSKVKRSGSATVDYTERRFLKTIKGGGPGQLSIQRSETRFVKLDAEFERKLQGK